MFVHARSKYFTSTCMGTNHYTALTKLKHSLPLERRNTVVRYPMAEALWKEKGFYFTNLEEKKRHLVRKASSECHRAEAYL